MLLGSVYAHQSFILRLMAVIYDNNPYWRSCLEQIKEAVVPKSPLISCDEGSFEWNDELHPRQGRSTNGEWYTREMIEQIRE
jgi:hypothetical protein